MTIDVLFEAGLTIDVPFNKEINLSLYSHIIIHLGTNDFVNSTTDKNYC